MRRVITYGTFDLLHYGHINLLRRAREQGDYLIVALSTDEFNWNEKRKKSYFSYDPLCRSRHPGGELGSEDHRRGQIPRGCVRHGRRLEGQVRLPEGQMRGRLPPPHARDLHDEDQDRSAHLKNTKRMPPGERRAACVLSQSPARALRQALDFIRDGPCPLGLPRCSMILSLCIGLQAACFSLPRHRVVQTASGSSFRRGSSGASARPASGCTSSSCR